MNKLTDAREEVIFLTGNGLGEEKILFYEYLTNLYNTITTMFNLKIS